MAAYDLNQDNVYGHIKTKKDRTTFLEFCRYLRSLYPPGVRIAIVLDNFSPHRSTQRDTRVGDWAQANNVELAYVPTNASWLNRIEAQFQALRYFTLDGTDHRSHEEQNSMIRRYIIWRDRNAQDKAPHELVKRATLLDAALGHHLRGPPPVPRPGDHRIPDPLDRDHDRGHGQEDGQAEPGASHVDGVVVRLETSDRPRDEVDGGAHHDPDQDGEHDRSEVPSDPVPARRRR
jgi:transposase